MAIKDRIARLEAKLLPKPDKPWATFLWSSDADNAALAEAEKAAEEADRNIMVIRIVSPKLDANGRVIKEQEQ